MWALERFQVPHIVTRDAALILAIMPSLLSLSLKTLAQKERRKKRCCSVEISAEYGR